ncbi:MAG: hypothetical protein PHF67_02850 [Candidatus Nanoarchaeia archaeon]|nr:hypothetical protein [Candidatus Nanoarchaeia archaeon]
MGVSLINAEDFFRNARPCTIVEDMFRQRRQEEEKQLIDPAALRAMQDWSYLNQLVVGEEYKGPQSFP